MRVCTVYPVSPFLVCRKGYLQGFEFAAATSCSAKQSTAVCHRAVSQTPSLCRSVSFHKSSALSSRSESKARGDGGWGRYVCDVGRKQVFFVYVQLVTCDFDKSYQRMQAGKESQLREGFLLLTMSVNLPLPFLRSFTCWQHKTAGWG